MTSTAELTKHAQFLRNGAPQAYNDFCEAFARYTGAAVQNLIKADTNFLVAQGQAQMCANLLKVLEDVRNG